MTKEEAITIVCDIATRWGENLEEDFPSRINATMSDVECEAIAARSASSYHVDDIIEVRDLWRAVALLTATEP